MLSHSSQLRAARSLLGWDQKQLAEQAELGVATIRRLEAQEGRLQSHTNTIDKLTTVLEAAGIIFLQEELTGGVGVRLRRV